MFLILEPLLRVIFMLNLPSDAKKDGFKFVLYTVYGLAQHQNKQAFSYELANTCSKESLPCLIRSD